MQISLTPLLLAIELGFVAVLAWRSSRSAASVWVYLTGLAAYGVLTSVLGARGVYTSEALLPTLPGLWLLGLAMVVIVAPVVAVASLRDALREIVDATPWHWFAWFHALRIGALGTAYKTAIGEFPLHFELGVGVPDLLFGLSAVWVAWKTRRGELSERAFLIWNLIGVLVIVPAAPILIQLGLPGPLQVFADSRAILTYPMSIAPLLGVPLFISINLCVAWRLWERARYAADHDDIERGAG